MYSFLGKLAKAKVVDVARGAAPDFAVDVEGVDAVSDALSATREPHRDREARKKNSTVSGAIVVTWGCRYLERS